jgi:hypothetical protein
MIEEMEGSKKARIERCSEFEEDKQDHVCVCAGSVNVAIRRVKKQVPWKKELNRVFGFGGKLSFC